MNKLIAIKTAINKGFLHIFSASVLNKLIQFGISIVIVRIVSKEVYGSYSYSINILNWFLILQGLGVVSGILQYCSTEDCLNKKIDYFKYGLKIGIIFNIVIAVMIIIFTSIWTLPVKGSSSILFYFSIIPLLAILYESIQVYFRASLKNKEFSLLSILNTLLYFLGTVILGLIFKTKGIIAAKYISYIIVIIIGGLLLKEEIKKIIAPITLTLIEKKEFLRFSLISSATNSASKVLYLIDVLLIGIFIKNQEVVATYKIATIIPFALNFVPASIMIYAYPYFAKNKDNKFWIRDKYIMLIKYLGIFNLGLCTILIVFAPHILMTLFGKEYMSATSTFRILSLGYLVAGTFRIPAGNILLSINKVNINFYNAIASGLLNVGLDIVMILKLGSIGAAITTVTIFIVSSLISNLYIYKHLRNNA